MEKIKEEKQKKIINILIGIIIGIFLSIIGILIYKFVLIDNSSDIKETNCGITDTNTGNIFTKLERYEIKEGEKEFFTVNNKNVTFEYKNKKIYLNEKEIDDVEYEIHNFYITDKLFITSYYAQAGEVLYFYDLNGNKIEKKFNNFLQIRNLRIENNKLVGNTYDLNVGLGGDAIAIENIFIAPCGLQGSYNGPIDKYKDMIEKHKNDVIEGVMEIEYKDNIITNKLISSIVTVEDFINEDGIDNFCVADK